MNHLLFDLFYGIHISVMQYIALDIMIIKLSIGLYDFESYLVTFVRKCVKPQWAIEE